MKRTLALLVVGGGVVTGLLVTGSLWAQAPQSPPNTQAPQAGSTLGSPHDPGANVPTVVRDPRTGRLYHQQVQMVDQPVVTYQRKVMDQTITTPQVVYENQQVPQTIYVPKTEYVLQTKLKGWWNPFAQPTYAYEYVPVTRWVPQTQYQNVQVPTVKMIPRTEKVTVDEPVQTTQKVAQVTLRPYQPTAPVATTYAGVPNSVPPANWVNYRGNATAQPLIASVPVLAQPRPLTSWQPGPLLTAPVTGLRNAARAVAAPFNSQATYTAPTSVATLPTTSHVRDLNQTGMQATVLR